MFTRKGMEDWSDAVGQQNDHLSSRKSEVPPRYYGPSKARCWKWWEGIKQFGCDFLVAGRVLNGAFTGATRRAEAMAQLRQTVLLHSWSCSSRSWSQRRPLGRHHSTPHPQFVPLACFGFNPNQFPENGFFAAGGDSSSHNICHNIWRERAKL